jgi:hypothetical protein
MESTSPPSSAKVEQRLSTCAVENFGHSSLGVYG